jgi:hypothetical protein
MANFCSKCGARLASGRFCGACGAPVAEPAPSPQVPGSPAPSPGQTPAAAGPVAPAPPVQPTAPKKSNTALTIVLVLLAVIFLGGVTAVAGLFYVAHRVRHRVHELESQFPTGSTSETTASVAGVSGNPCRLLSKDVVGQSIGIEIVSVEPTSDGCSYLAKGNSADMSSRHLAALSGVQGANAQQQQTIQTLAGGLFKSAQDENHESGQDANGNVPVFVFGIQDQGAQMQMQLTRKIFTSMGPSLHDLAGLGDDAYDIAGAMMMVRKGDKLIRIMYTTCPCNTAAVEPLARKLAGAL